MIETLELKGVGKNFPNFRLNNISLSLPKGYIMGLVGPNGAGKTTTIQLILNMLEKDAGEILVFDKDNVKDERAVKQDTVLENFPLFCPKCKKETLIKIRELNMVVIKEPDA